MRRVRQLPARLDGTDAGADREAVAPAVRSVHAADAAEAAPATADRVRMADQARRRRHRSLDEADPPAAGDPPRHRARPALDLGRARPDAQGRRVPTRLRPASPRRLSRGGPRHAPRARAAPYRAAPAWTASRGIR